MDHSVRWLAYRARASRQTLTEGLAEYYAANVGRVTPPASLGAASAPLFASHDICHVIFGLDTTLDDEAVADARTMLSCDVDLAIYAGYLRTNPEVRAVFRQAGYLKSAWAALRATPRLLRAWRESARMTRKWPWIPPDSYLGRTLADLRDEFGINVI